jgi:hypothetical protein
MAIRVIGRIRLVVAEEFDMSLKERLKRQLLSARQTSEGFLADFKTPQEWVNQVHGEANHALWFAGHMGISDNFFISVIAPEKAKKLPEMDSRFGMGSHPTNRVADYPPVEEVLTFMRERRKTLLEVLDQLADGDLAQKTPEGTPDFLPDIGSVFEMAIWHEGLHSGQLSVARRALGHKPKF